MKKLFSKKEKTDLTQEEIEQKRWKLIYGFLATEETTMRLQKMINRERLLPVKGVKIISP